MELYQLNTFVTVARTSSVTRAAEILHTTPPSVSNHIRQIEEDLDIQLFTRTSKGMFITSQGEQLLNQVLETLNSVEKLKTMAKELKSDVKGRVVLAINSTPEFLRIPAIIDMVMNRFPGIKLEILPSSTGLILESVENGTITCGFAFGPLKENGVHSIFLSRVKLVIAIPARFKADFQKSSITALAQLPWVVPENFCPFLKLVKDHINQKGFQLENKIFANDDITKFTLVRKGRAVCVLEESEARPFIDNKTLVPWAGPDQFESKLSFVYATHRADDILVSTMKSVVQSVWDNTA